MNQRKGVRRLRNVEFARVGGRHLRLDVTVPSAPVPAGRARRPALMQIHGGGWVIGDKREQGLPLLNHMAAQGWVGFNVNYRLSPGVAFPDHLIDLKRGLAWIKEHADEYGIDPDFVCVTGGSAGGHLTALMGLTANDPALPARLRGRRHERGRRRALLRHLRLHRRAVPSAATRRSSGGSSSRSS